MSDTETRSDSDRPYCNLSVKELIAEISRRPEVWNREHLKYKDKKFRNQTWMEIAAKLNRRYDFSSWSRGRQHEETIRIVKKWNNLRDAYRKYIITSKTKTHRHKYHHAEQLSFLNGQFKIQNGGLDKNDSENREEFLITIKEDNGNEEEYEEQHEEWLNDYEETPNKIAKLNVDRDPVNTSTNIKDPINTTSDDVVSTLVNMIHREEDEDRAFFTSIIPTVKTLSNDNMLIFRMKVMKLLQVLKSKGKFESDTE